MRAIRTDIFKTGELPRSTWCIGFNTTATPHGGKGRAKLHPTDLGIYVNYRGDPYRLDKVGLLHISRWPDYWVEMEVPEESTGGRKVGE